MSTQSTHDLKINSQVVPDVRHRSVNGNLVADERAEAVVHVRRQVLALVGLAHLDRGPVLSGSLPPEIGPDGLPVVPVDLRAQVVLLVYDRLQEEQRSLGP